jgi:hypothetical protein
VDAERGDVAAVIRAVVIVVIVVVASRADARPKIPKALAGVPLADDDSEAELLDVKYDGTFKLGGAKVIAFRQRFVRELQMGHGDRTGESTTQVALADAATKKIVYRRDVASHRYQVVGGEETTNEQFAYDARWRDENGDGEPELLLTKTAGEGPGKRVFQLRFGDLVELSTEIVRCPRAPEDTFALGAVGARDVAPKMVARFVARLDDGDPADEALCAYADAAAASRLDAPMPAVGEAITVAPIATGCPGLAWALRHGRSLTPSRIMAFVDTVGQLARVQVRNDTLSVATIDLTEHVDGFGHVAWLERWVIDDRLWVFAEVTGDVERFAVVYDPYRDEVHTWRLGQHETVQLAHTTGKTGRFEVVLNGPDGRKTVWKREATSWH